MRTHCLGGPKSCDSKMPPPVSFMMLALPAVLIKAGAAYSFDGETPPSYQVAMMVAARLVCHARREHSQSGPSWMKR